MSVTILSVKFYGQNCRGQIAAGEFGLSKQHSLKQKQWVDPARNK